MYLKRDNLIKKQIVKNQKSENYSNLSDQMLRRLSIQAFDELSLRKINSREIDYTKIQMFLLLAPEIHKEKFYQTLKTHLKNIFNDEKSKQTFQEKWSSFLKSNIMRLFNQIAAEKFHRKHFYKLYSDTIIKLFQEDKLSRIQQKFLEPFLVELISKDQHLQYLDLEQFDEIKKQAKHFSQSLSKKEAPKSLTNCQFLQYACLSLLKLDLPHQKYLLNNLIHAPNPKFLLPFRKKGTFISLTNQMLVKMNKIDMVGIKYWSYFPYQQCDIYQKIRKAAGWESKVDILLLVLKTKLKDGLIRYLNLINEKAMLYSNRQITDEGINSLNSYVQMSLQICLNQESSNFANALEKVDIGHAFQNKSLARDSRLKDFMLKVVNLYLILLDCCTKKNLRLKFIRNIAINICKLIDNHSQEKFKAEMVHIVANNLRKMNEDDAYEFFYSIIQFLNRQWESKQQILLNNEIAKINPFTVNFLALLINEFGLQDNGNPDLKVLKLEFFYIMALNFKQSIYFQSKKLLSRVSIDINNSLSNNSILNILDTRKSSHQMFKQHLKSLYGQQIESIKTQYEGLLAVIDEVVTYRIQVIKDTPYNSKKHSFYALLVSFLEQAEGLDPTHKMLDLVLNYFLKCKKTYQIEINQMKYNDESKVKTKQFITEEVCYLIQGSVSANPIIASFCQRILFQHIEAIPQLAFYTKTLVVFAECISALYKKQSQEYESKAEKIKGKYLTETILIPTNNKQVIKRLSKIMCAMYQVVLRAHCIDDNYLKVKASYLIRQNSKSSIRFGWKFLKHLLSSFKQDRQFILSQILNNNNCSWFINEDYFSQKLKKVKTQKIVLDPTLFPLHAGNCDKADLKKIILTVEPQNETEFLIVPLKSTRQQIFEIIKQLQEVCLSMQVTRLYDSTNHLFMEDQQNKLYDIISRVKMIYLNKIEQVQITSKIFDVCIQYNNAELLNYVILKIVPFFYCLSQFDEITLSAIAECLNHIVTQLNTVTRLVLQKSAKDSDIFDVNLNCFNSLEAYERQEENNNISALTQHLIGKSQKMHRYMIIKLHNFRLETLQKMYLHIMQFLNSHFHVIIANGIPLRNITKAFSTNFQLDNYALQFLPLQSIGHCLTSHLQLVNILKASLEKGETLYDETVVDQFYFKTLKLGLYHFQKRKTTQQIQLSTQSRNIKSMRNKIGFFIRICDYLRNDDFHKIHKKKLPKRNQIFSKNQTNNQLESLLDYNKPKKQPLNELSSRNESLTLRRQRLNINNETYLDLPVLRYSLLYLISELIDRIKAYSFTQLGEIANPYSLAGKKKFINNSQIHKLFQYLGKSSKVLIFLIVKTFGNRLEDPEQFLGVLRQSISTNPDYGFPDFIDLYVQRNKDDPNKLKQINFWKTQNIQVLFKYLTPQYQKYPYLQLYVTKVLSRLHSGQILFYLPQIYQALTLQTGKIIYSFLLDYARKSASFAHQLIWIAKVQSKQQKDAHNKNPRLPGVDQNLTKLQKISTKLIKDTIRQFNREQKSFFRQVDGFYEEVTAISGKMVPQMTSAQKKDRIRVQVQKIKLPKSVYLPINPTYQVVSINIQSGTPMQSAAKCPFLLSFNCVEYCGPDEYFQNLKKHKRTEALNNFDYDLQQIREEQIPQSVPDIGIICVGSRIKKDSKSEVKSFGDERISEYNLKLQKNGKKSGIIDINSIQIQFDNDSKRGPRNSYHMKKQTVYFNNSTTKTTEISCIFKVFDDIRQDCLALQIIRLFMEIYQRHNLQLKLFPYKTISNRTGSNLNIGGIIEVVPKTVSRDSIGKTNEESLYEFFINNFGAEYNINFQSARQNFIKSQAAYSVISYILQIKDRHNGNILINKEQGYLIHIDFGFIFDISPANNLRFQRADFKLTQEMIKIMGGKIDSQPFQLYLNLVIKGFLIARKYHQHIMNIVKQMFHSGLPCFLEKSLQNLQSRFLLDMNEIQAASQMKNIVLNAADHWTTNWYDRIQWIQQKIYH